MKIIISGVRIIVKRLLDLRICIELIISKYKIDYSNSNFNPHSFKNDNEFGYLSSHIIIKSGGLKTEIQIRTFSQHIWAITSHSLDYKSQFKDSIFPRKLFRLSGLLEQIDLNIEDLYDTAPVINKSSLISLGTLDHYSLEYFLSRKERIFALITLAFEIKSKFIGSIKWSFSEKIFDDEKASYGNNKEVMAVILTACRVLNINTIEEFRLFLIKKSNHVKKIKLAFNKSDLKNSPISKEGRIELFIVAFLNEKEIEYNLKDIVHPDYLKSLIEFRSLMNS